MSWCASRQHQRCTKHLWWSTLRQYHHERCTCIIRCVHRACTSSVRNTCGGVLCASTIMNVAPAFFVVYIAPAAAVYETPVVVCIALAPAVYASCSVTLASERVARRMFRVSISIGILGARVCGLCRTCCDFNRWLRFSP